MAFQNQSVTVKPSQISPWIIGNILYSWEIRMHTWAVWASLCLLQQIQCAEHLDFIRSLVHACLLATPSVSLDAFYIQTLILIVRLLQKFCRVIYLLYQFADSVEKENVNSMQLKQLLNSNNWRKVFMHRHKVTSQCIQLVYQNACRA